MKVEVFEMFTISDAGIYGFGQHNYLSFVEINRKLCSNRGF